MTEKPTEYLTSCSTCGSLYCCRSLSSMAADASCRRFSSCHAEFLCFSVSMNFENMADWATYTRKKYNNHTCPKCFQSVSHHRMNQHTTHGKAFHYFQYATVRCDEAGQNLHSLNANFGSNVVEFEFRHISSHSLSSS